MWQEICSHISEQTKENFSIVHRQSVTGGDINQSFYITDELNEYFVKVNKAQHYDNFLAEAYSLDKIANTETIRTPAIICHGQTEESSYLVLEWCKLTNGTSKHWFDLGEQLATMHLTTEHGEFGWEQNNFIGRTIQPNIWHANWRTFFAEQRIGWQLQLLKEKSISLGNINRIVEACHEILLHHKVVPCLVHGDLWQGNAGFIGNKPLIFDPACYYGDREVDIAMTELFGQFPQSFYQGYQDKYPLPPKYESRKQVYNFYHILNHANMFGGVYIDQARAILSRLLAKVR